MEQQKVFSTVFRGFEKKAVLDYIYEQDMLFKKKEAEWERQLRESEERLEMQPSPEERAPMEALKQEAEALRQQLAEATRRLTGREQELLLQVQQNQQLSSRCEALESKLKVLADHLLTERENAQMTRQTQAVEEASEPAVEIAVFEAPAEELPQEDAPASEVFVPEMTLFLSDLVAEEEDEDEEPQEIDAPIDAMEPATEIPRTEDVQYANLKDELDGFRQQVSETLLNLEAALARLETSKEPDTTGERNFF